MHESGDFRFCRSASVRLSDPIPHGQREPTSATRRQPTAMESSMLAEQRCKITDKANCAAYHDWCVEKGLTPPDFVAKPDLVNSDPWEGLAPIWYWDTHSFNRLADQGDIETITKKINGGMNGVADLVEHLVRLSLVVLGYAPGDIKKFQASAGLDGDPDRRHARRYTRLCLRVAACRRLQPAACRRRSSMKSRLFRPPSKHR
jgi:putative chitinase